MKTLIAYAGKSGTTEKCAKLLAEQLNEADIINLSEKTPNPNEYEIIVVGSNIHMGQLHKCVKKFITQYANVLKQKQSAYFICCGFPENQEQVFKANLPSELLDSAIAKMCFGGEMDISRLHGMDKMIAKMVTKASADKNIAPPSIQHKKITEMAELIKKL